LSPKLFPHLEGERRERIINISAAKLICEAQSNLSCLEYRAECHSEVFISQNHQSKTALLMLPLISPNTAPEQFSLSEFFAGKFSLVGKNFASRFESLDAKTKERNSISAINLNAFPHNKSESGSNFPWDDGGGRRKKGTETIKQALKQIKGNCENTNITCKT
jgi:hypothetical protein